MINRRWQAESVTNQIVFSRPISLSHRPELRDGHVGFIYDQQKILWKIVKNRIRRLPWQSLVKIEGIILNPIHKSGFSDHSDIVFHLFFDPLCLNRHAHFLKFLYAKLLFSIHLLENGFQI
mgnify:CR=1 FL=1